MWYRAVRFIVTLILSLLVASLAVDAQPLTKVHRIGRLDAGPPDPSVEAFQQGLRDLGYVEGQNLVIEYRWAEGEGRPSAPSGGRAGPAQRRGDCGTRKPGDSRCQAGHEHDPNRYIDRRSGWGRVRRDPRPPRREHHGLE